MARRMVNMNCETEGKHLSDDKKFCCDLCLPGSYKKTDCNGTRLTECARCPDGKYTAMENYMPHCRRCKTCSSSDHLRTVQECSSVQDRECGCNPGYFCSNEKCDACTPVRNCSPGYGVKVKATGTNDTVCERCEAGTFSSVMDYTSPCVPHKRCEDFGGVSKIPGTDRNDTVCDRFRTECPWMLPAGLWSGLVLTFIAFILFVIFCWWRKSRSYNTGRPGVNPEAPPTVFLQEPMFQAAFLPFPSMEVKSFCEETTCKVDGCNLPLIISADNAINGVTRDSEEVCKPSSPLKPSVSLVEPGYGNGNAVNYPGDFQRMFSEPQEDEWCDT